MTQEEVLASVSQAYAQRGYLVIGSVNEQPIGNIIRGIVYRDTEPNWVCFQPMRITRETDLNDLMAQKQLAGITSPVNPSWRRFYRVESD
jgi:hypothetical protein